jgi:hypothetical protein
VLSRLLGCSVLLCHAVLSTEGRLLRAADEVTLYLRRPLSTMLRCHTALCAHTPDPCSPIVEVQQQAVVQCSTIQGSMLQYSVQCGSLKSQWARQTRSSYVQYCMLRLACPLVSFLSPCTHFTSVCSVTACVSARPTTVPCICYCTCHARTVLKDRQ